MGNEHSQQRLDVEVVRSEDDLKQHLLVDLAISTRKQPGTAPGEPE